MRFSSPTIRTAGRAVAYLLALGLTALIGYGVVSALLAPTPAARQQRAIDVIRQMGGAAQADATAAGAPVVQVDLDPAPTGAAPPALGDDDLARLRPHLEALPELRHLRLGPHAAVTDAGLRHLQGLRRLEVLEVACSGVTPAGLEQFRRARPGVRLLYRLPDQPAPQELRRPEQLPQGQRAAGAQKN